MKIGEIEQQIPNIPPEGAKYHKECPFTFDTTRRKPTKQNTRNRCKVIYTESTFSIENRQHVRQLTMPLFPIVIPVGKTLNNQKSVVNSVIALVQLFF